MIRLRLAKNNECDLLFKWARSKHNKNANFMSYKKTLEQHRAWFKETRSKHICQSEYCDSCPPRKDILIAMIKDKPVGVVTVACDGELCIFMLPRWHYKDLGKWILWEAVDWVIKYRKKLDINYVYAECVNESSRKLFEKAGFNRMICGDYCMDI